MNANFRRDYLYRLDGSTLLRYLKYDRVKKEYIFLEGAQKKRGEFQLRVADTDIHVTNRRISKHRWVGYELTNKYLNSTRKDKVKKGVGRPSLFKPELITDIKLLVKGKKYKFSNIFNSNHHLKFKDGIYVVTRESSEGLNICISANVSIHQSYVSEGLVKIETIQE